MAAATVLALLALGAFSLAPAFAAEGDAPPVLTADAGPDQIVSDPDVSGAESVTLTGSATPDPGDGSLAFEWSEEGASLGSGPSLTVDFASNDGLPHTITLTVTDATGNVATDDVFVVVLSNEEPVADAGPIRTSMRGPTATRRSPSTARARLTTVKSLRTHGPLTGFPPKAPPPRSRCRWESTRSP